MRTLSPVKSAAEPGRKGPDKRKGPEMAGDATRRLANWSAKFDPERVKELLERKHEEMLRHVHEAFVELCDMEMQVRETLNASTVHTVLYVPYLDYARQIWKLTRKKNITGPSFALEAEILLQKWASRGLDAGVLARIRYEVFSTREPEE